ncbi:uncharacterized protein KY384_007192 [Bacidia gigantensis]|uniref:uncharacterized protein n=1 Tax=Bacidia gigantensis TaxID=2732470 RepID=UPI001D053451|nr:uncharacterized protein KY384_007192 [Bacidia gigantensis]KAG8528275.1 hypothetical protein KY384_007192 [Bacidia gigantensis]
MHSATALVITAIAIATVHVSATRYCQCENEQYGRIFSGINEVCSTLSNDWCSTNCNVAAKNCNYCQFKPAGYGNDADYESLKSWCYKQEGYDLQTDKYFKGSIVYCYSAKNAIPQSWYDPSCGHQSNGDWDKTPQQPAPPAETNVTQVPPSNYLIVNYWLKKVNRLGSHECKDIYKSAINKVASAFLSLHPDCGNDTQRPDTDNIRYLACPVYTYLDLDPRIIQLNADLDKVCLNVAGGDEGGEGPGAPTAAIAGPEETGLSKGAAKEQAVIIDL